MHSIVADIFLMVFGFTGFILAFYIHHKKHEKKPLVCPLNSDCDAVITSKWSSFLGIPLEILGMCYYGSIVVLHAIVAAYPFVFSSLVENVSLGVSAIAFCFSLYLISIQAFILKQWCTWCLCSATLCVFIFIMTYVSSPGVLY